MGKNLEICLNADDHIQLADNVKTAFTAGASRIELCSTMQLEGLTPSATAMTIAAHAMPSQGELLIMIRPVANQFIVDATILKLMLTQIAHAAHAGATGVVFGALNANDVDIAATTALIACAHKYNLVTTFHRAFDCIEDSEKAIALLTELGVDRILTNGTKWTDNKGVMQGLNHLQTIINHANDHIEIVIGGGVTIDNASTLWQLTNNNLVSLHAYSSVHNKDGCVDPLLINAILNQRTNKQAKND
ncbi:copper homeostasis protein CutC [Pseudoalteromonas arctica]|uniref:Copper homeostasis protein cutC homolog n=1 Tax=Pseudoalteromonas arctica TaxID=394751 RepID=A0A7Y0DQD8_9GAMM|nr:copper homeostasis protein CutC [Pseudoalteromonas arctica]NMM39720.1 copper homeostasis protein CutC [Pseudoalteromonas arctica]